MTEVTPRWKTSRARSCSLPLCTDSHPCAKCRGRAAQATARKRLKIRGARFRTQLANEETYGDPLFRWSHKDGAQVRPVFTAYAKAANHDDGYRAVGDTRGFILSCSLEGYEDELLVIRRSAWMRDVRPCLDEL